MNIEYKAVGDRNLLIQFPSQISLQVNEQVRKMYLAIEKHKITGIEETIPAYCSLLISYNPLLVKAESLKKQLLHIEELLMEIDVPEPRIIEVPTLYGGDFGPDLEFVAKHNRLEEDEVIKIHSQADYLIYMLGFTPGFPYLGGLSPRIATPRHANPRSAIPPGSVGIAETQTGIYPIESPGGWRIIGRTPLKLFNPKHSPFFLLQQGDYLRFVPINLREYLEIEVEVEKGEYRSLL